MDGCDGLEHSKWECKRFVVNIRKCRRRVLCNRYPISKAVSRTIGHESASDCRIHSMFTLGSSI